MADFDITSIDLAEGLKTKNVVVPAMVVDVVLSNPPADLLKAWKGDKLIVQKVGGAAIDVLNKSRKTFQAAVKDIDDGYTKKPPADAREAEDRARTLTTVCKQIVDAQKSAAIAAATGEWNTYIKKNKDLTKFKVVFGVKTALGTISVAASVAAAVLSMGTLAITILGAAKTVAGMAADIYNYCRDIAKAEQDIIDADKVLAETWTDDKLTAGKTGRELAAALGIPFVKSIGGLSKLLTEYNAKNAMKDQVAEKAWSKAKELMSTVSKAEKSAGASMKPALEKLGNEVGNLLDQISALSAASKSNDLFHKTYEARCATYEAMQGKKLGRAAGATGVLAMAAGIASTAKTMVDIAAKLA